MWWREESEKFSLSQHIKMHKKSSGKYYWSPWNFEKTQVPLGWPNRYKFYSTAEKAIVEISKSALDSLKSVFYVFRRRLLLGAPVEWERLFHALTVRKYGLVE